MLGIIIKVVVGLGLFVGSLVGGLAATGRLNHEGTANIPVLGSFFPEPVEVEGEDDHSGDDPAAADAHAAPGGETSAAMHAGEASVADASHEQDPTKPVRSKIGRSVDDPDPVPVDDGHGDDGHGADPHADDGHGADAAAGGGHAASAGDGHAAKPAVKSHQQPSNSHDATPMTPAERDFDNMQRALRSQGKTGYQPGELFRFDGLPAGLQPDQINEAWQRVQGMVQKLERRTQVLDEREQELAQLGGDISRRWKELGEERLEVEQMQRQLDAKIQKFQETVILVRDDEVKLLKRNAETLGAFEADKAAELISRQWETEAGQREVLRLMEFMKKDTVTGILAELPTAMVQDILRQRLLVSREATPSGNRK